MPKSQHDSSIKKALKKLSQHLEEMAENMRTFSSCFRTLYTDQAVHGHDEAAVKFRKIRDDTRRDAMVYLKCILPATTNFIRSVKEYFQYYEALSYEEWCEMLQDILEETRTNENLAQTVLDIHHDITDPLKTRQNEARMVMAEFVNLQSVYHLSEGSPRGNMAQTVASEMQYDINKNAARTVAETLTPALSGFVDGLKKVARFFGIIENELELFEGRSEGDMDERKQSYYKVIRNSAKRIISLCAAFCGILPDVRTDFEALPSQDTDQNYVDKWLEKTFPDIESQTTFKALLGTSTVMEERELVDTVRQSNQAERLENNRSPTPADDSAKTSKSKPGQPPKLRRPSTPVYGQVPTSENKRVPIAKYKPELPPRDRSASVPVDDQVPASKNKQAPTSKIKPELPPRDGSALVTVDDYVPASKNKPEPPPRDRSALEPVDDYVPASKNRQASTSKNRPASAPADAPSSKNKPAKPPRYGSTPVKDSVPMSENKKAQPPVDNAVPTTKKRRAPSPPGNGRTLTTAANDRAPPSKNRQGLTSRRPASTQSDHTVTTPKNKQAPTSKNKRGATTVDDRVPKSKNKPTNGLVSTQV